MDFDCINYLNGKAEEEAQRARAARIRRWKHDIQEDVGAMAKWITAKATNSTCDASQLGESPSNGAAAERLPLTSFGERRRTLTWSVSGTFLTVWGRLRSSTSTSTATFCGEGPGKPSAKPANSMDGRVNWSRRSAWTSSTTWRGYGLPSPTAASSRSGGSKSGRRAFRSQMVGYLWRSRKWLMDAGMSSWRATTF